MAPSESNSVGRADSRQGQPIDVLVVDDDTAILEQLAECFSVSGLTSSAESSALVALQRIAQGLRPAVVLTDLRMPELDGLHFAEKLNQLPREARPEIVFMSGHADMKDAIEAIRLGARDLLVKPIDRDKILRSVESARLVYEQSLRPAAFPEQSPDMRPSIAGASQDADVRRNAQIGRAHV